MTDISVDDDTVSGVSVKGTVGRASDFVISKHVSPGYTTTEFWQSLIAGLGGLAVVVFGIVNNNADVLWAGVALTGVSTTGYSISRGIAKKG